MEPLTVYLLIGSLAYLVLQGRIIYLAAHDEKHYVTYSAYREKLYVVSLSILAMTAVVFWPVYLAVWLFVRVITLSISVVKKIIK